MTKHVKNVTKCDKTDKMWQNISSIGVGIFIGEFLLKNDVVTIFTDIYFNWKEKKNCRFYLNLSEIFNSILVRDEILDKRKKKC